MDSERWLPVVGFEGFYEVSNLGRARSLRCGPGHKATTLRRVARVLKPKREYRLRASDGVRVHEVDRFAFSKPGLRTRYLPVGRVVLEAFVGPCPDGMECAHVDGDPANNRLENLRWDSHVENLRDRDERHATGAIGRRQGSAKLDEPSVREIIRLRSCGATTAGLAEEFSVCEATISHILTGRNWSHLRGAYNITSTRNGGRSRLGGSAASMAM